MTRTAIAAHSVVERSSAGATRVATVIASHPVVDAYAGYVPPLLAVHRTSLASSLMMGGPWAVASLGPPLAQMSIERHGVGAAFGLTAVLLAASALVTLPLSSPLLRRVAEA